MELTNILTFMAVASLLVISPGPNGFLIAKTVPMSGRKAGFANIAGFVAAFYLHGTLSIFGISILLLQSGMAFFIFKMLGAAYLIWIGIKAIRNAFKKEDTLATGATHENQKPASMRVAFIEGFLTNALNPKVSMFYLAAFPQFISQSQGALSAYSLVFAHSLVNFLWFSMMVITLSHLKQVASNARVKALLSSITGVVFIGFGAKLAFSKSS